MMVEIKVNINCLIVSSAPTGRNILSKKRNYLGCCFKAQTDITTSPQPVGSDLFWCRGTYLEATAVIAN